MKNKLLLISCIFLVLFGSAQTNTINKEQFIRTSGKLPSLAYGLGEDRLGGAKMGYIDTNVLLKIIDSTKDLYHVQLSKNHSAYIDKSFSKFEPDTFKLKKFYLSGSFVVKGDSAFDYLNINMDEKLPYKASMEINPAKIIIDVFGVQSNTNWITQLSSIKEIKNVYYNQVEDDVLRVTIELQHTQHWGYGIGYKGKALVVKVNRQPKVLDIKQLTIAIDAGHGGTNTGAGGVKTNASEKAYTLIFAKALEKSLKKIGVKKIIMTRTFDTSFDMKDRILSLQEANPNLVISLHLNSTSNPSTKGTSTFYKHIGFRPISTAILKRMLELKLEEYGNVGHFNFGLNAPTNFPNCLVEIAFLSNEEDEKRIISPLFHKQVATKIQLGIIDWLKGMK